MKKSLVLLTLALSLAVSLAPGYAETENQWWQYSYEGNALPTESKPSFAHIDPKVKAGMEIRDTVKDGILSMTCIGEGATDYYIASFSGSGYVWRGESEKGITLEARLRAPKPAEGLSNAILSTGGYGTDGKYSYDIIIGTKGIGIAGKGYPVDMTQFHVIRYTYEPSAKLFTLYLDGTKLSETSLDKMTPSPVKNNRLLFGFTYPKGMQGTIEIDYIRWTCEKVSPPQAEQTKP